MNDETPRFFDAGSFCLRPYRMEDAPQLRDATNESYELMKEWLEWATPDQTLGQAEKVCERLGQYYDIDQDYTLAVLQDGRLIGGTGFHPRCGPRAWGCSEIGMWIRATEANRGWGTRVLSAMLDWGFGEWGWERLEWRCDTRNLASARVAIKNGLTLDGTLRSNALAPLGDRRDTHVFGILKSEWVKS